MKEIKFTGLHFQESNKTILAYIDKNEKIQLILEDDDSIITCNLSFDNIIGLLSLFEEKRYTSE